jgi:serine O-acetyltransferase
MASRRSVRIGTGALTVVYGPLLALIACSPASASVWDDATAWERPMGARHVSARDGKLLWLTYLLAKHREFRSLAYYRLSRSGPFWAAAASVAGCFYRPQVALSFDCPEIGPRLFIEHGFATTVTAARIGADCWINQNVTIGRSARPGLPTLEDGVYVRAGAVVAGPIRIGRGAHIGANSVVLRDVPAGMVVGGAPARPLKQSAGTEP